MSDYREVGELGQYFLEESYVLSIQASPGDLSLEMDLALSPEHPQHEPASPNERHCYRRGTIRYSGVKDLQWFDQGTPPAVDATGELDYGNIDSLTVEGDAYGMEGDFGRITIVARDISILLRG
ncbi:hypothetical protein [Streptomyces mangrovisoli]|uniref:hypothetical protein n=1 Tax=Streptomyces mangrovisoli TaxID=1428628 RepID=UPI0009A0B4F6|nr:hypothetical protein [Streptomyces mangrovisoli]